MKSAVRKKAGTKTSKGEKQDSTEIKGDSKRLGGARVGSGRKSAGTEQVTIRLQPWERDFVKKVAEDRFRSNLSMAHSAFIEAWAIENGYGNLYNEMRDKALQGRATK